LLFSSGGSPDRRQYSSEIADCLENSVFRSGSISQTASDEIADEFNGLRGIFELESLAALRHHGGHAGGRSLAKLRAQTDETSGADQNRGPSARSLGKRPGNTMAPRS